VSVRLLGLRTAAALTALNVSWAPAGADDGLDLSPASVPLDQIVDSGPGKDGIVAIEWPRFVAASDSRFLADEDRVIGVAHGKAAKAYPLRILNWHQVVNDTFGRRRIAVTYCPLTGSAVVFRRRFGGMEHTFGVSGRLYEGNMLLYDHETASLWSQLASIALTGDRMGDHLHVIPSIVAEWEDWRRDHPATVVLAPDHGHARDYTRNPYVAYDASSAPMFSPARHDGRLQDKQRVLGVTLSGRDRAYPFSELQYAASPVRDRIGSREIAISFDGREAVAMVDGELVPATSMYWFAWAAFHPMTSIWYAPRIGPLDGPVRNSDVTIEEQKSYWTRLPCTLTADPDHQPFAGTGLFVISGKLKNSSDLPLHHIRLRFALVDPVGKVVYHEEGYNRSAESLMELEEGAVSVGEPEEVREIPPGGHDTFRMIMIGEEIPPFDHPDVTVVSAR
jgi:hypothetical protein